MVAEHIDDSKSQSGTKSYTQVNNAHWLRKCRKRDYNLYQAIALNLKRYNGTRIGPSMAP